MHVERQRVAGASRDDDLACRRSRACAVDVDRLRETGGGCFVPERDARARRRRAARPSGTRPSRTARSRARSRRSVERSSSAAPGGLTRARGDRRASAAARRRDAAERAAGTTPAPATPRRARKSALRVVVTPGETGAPSCPSKLDADVARASPARRARRRALPVRARRAGTRPAPVRGTTTHGPGTRDAAWMPLHSFVAPPTRAERGDHGERDDDAPAGAPHGILLNQSAGEQRPREHEGDPAARRRRRSPRRTCACVPSASRAPETPAARRDRAPCVEPATARPVRSSAASAGATGTCDAAR